MSLMVPYSCIATCETLEPAQEIEGDKKPPSSSKFSQFGNQKSL